MDMIRRGGMIGIKEGDQKVKGSGSGTTTEITGREAPIMMVEEIRGTVEIIEGEMGITEAMGTGGTIETIGRETRTLRVMLETREMWQHIESKVPMVMTTRRGEKRGSVKGEKPMFLMSEIVSEGIGMTTEGSESSIRL